MSVAAVEPKAIDAVELAPERLPTAIMDSGEQLKSSATNRSNPLRSAAAREDRVVPTAGWARDNRPSPPTAATGRSNPLRSN